MNPTVLATVNEKGGVAKTTSCINIGAAMAREGKKVLLVDTDPQGSMTISLGNQQPDQLVPTIADLMTKVMNDIPIAPGEGMLLMRRELTCCPLTSRWRERRCRW